MPRSVMLALIAVLGAAPAAGGPGLVFQSDRWEAQSLAADRLLAVTDIGNLRLVLSNSATFGTAFQARETPSMEWPARSGIDHLVRGALWIGATSAATGTHVSTGGRDAYYLDPIFQHSEFTPTGGRPEEFSRLRTSPFYRLGTIADENFHSTYVDTLPVVKDRSEPPHVALGLRVVQETYGWGFDPLDDFVVVEFNIVNVGEADLREVWIGVYSEMVTNNRLANWGGASGWPPSSRWFDFQEPHWDAERRLLWNRNVEHRFVNDEVRAGIKVLGSGGRGPTGRGPDSLSTKQISLSAWNWNPSQFYTWSDDSLYARMNTGTIADLSVYEPNYDNNPTTILSVGPFAELAVGDTVQVVFAFLAGENRADLEKNAAWAQKAYDDEYAVPSPPSPPRLRVHPRHNELVLRWDDSPETEPDPATHLEDFQGYRVYLSESPLATSYRLVRQVDRRDGVGFDTGLDVVRLPEPVVDGGFTYQYELSLPGIPDGAKRYVTVTSYDWQVGEPQSLESGVLSNSIYCIAGPDEAQSRGRQASVFPNPYRGESSFDGRDAQGAVNPRKRVMWFVNLPPRCRIRIYTLAGDLVRTIEHDAATYTGLEAAGIRPDNADLAQGRTLVTGGSMAGFDLLSEDRQEVSSGLYLFSVEDRDTGEAQQGKFLVLK